VVMTTGAMNVTMGKFHFGCLAHFHYFNIKRQCLAGHRMIGINRRHRVAHFQHSDLLMTMRRVNNSLHARLPFLGALQLADWDTQFILGTQFTEGLVRRQRDSEYIAHLFAHQRFLETFEQRIMTVQVRHGLTAFGTFKLYTLVVLQRVVKACNTVVGNLHKN